MGYSTDFDGSITISPPLSQEEITYLNKFSNTRRMKRKSGDYNVEGCEDFGDDDIIEFNQSPQEQPGLWCQWVPSDDGSCILWDDGEKFYESAAWMEYIIAHFIGEDPIAKQVDPTRFGFLQGHTCEGDIFASGEDSDDFWKIEVRDNVVSRVEGQVSYDLHAVGASDEPIDEDSDDDHKHELLESVQDKIRELRLAHDAQGLPLRAHTFERVLRDLEEAAGIHVETCHCAACEGFV